MTDPRMGDALWSALKRMPRGSGVVFRHYSLPDAERRAAYDRVRRIARRRGLLLVVAGMAHFCASDGRHGRDPRRAKGLKSWPAHSAREVIAGTRARADVIFLSPVFPTNSHPGARPLGRVRAAALARLAAGKAIALGGMKPQHAGWLRIAGFSGFAAIDAWTSADQKWSAVPI